VSDALPSVELPPAAGAGRRSAWSRLALVAVAVASFATVAAGVRSVTPWPEEYGVRSKFEYFERNKDRFDALFFGSSRVYRSFVPAVIADELATRGIELAPFNLGNPAMGVFESDFLLREALALEPARLRFVFIEVGHWNPAYPEQNAFSTRLVHWHSLAETRNVLEAVVTHRKRHKRWALALAHLRHWGWKLVSYGRGLDILAAACRLEPPDDEALGHLDRDLGYRALEDEPGEEFERRRRSFREELGDFERRVALLRRREDRPSGLAGYNLAAIARQVELVRAAGAEPIYVVPPGIKDMPDPTPLVRAGHVPALLAYHRPSAHPFLYEARWHFDANHLDRRGAERFSRVFARDLAELLAERAGRD